MAEMIPDQLPHRASKGEERLFNILKRLPDNYIVYYEPIVENRYPDFVIICPDMGLMIIEVKGWYAKEIIATDHNSVLIKGQHGEVRYNHPVRQARDYMLSLMDQCRENPSCRRLLVKEGEQQNKFIFPFGHFAVLSNITSDHLLNHPAGDLTSIFSVEKNITRDVLMEWADNEDLSENDVCKILQDKFNPYWEIPVLTEEQIDILRSIIHPEIIISTSNRSESSATTSSIKVLDLKQEQNARKIGDGHRIIFGVAGSGKTVLLISKARLISTQRPNDNVLLLCYNVALSVYLKSCLADCSNITVMHFDGWSKRNGVVRRNNESSESLGRRLLQVLENGNGDAGKYQLVMIDEAQDFDATWFRCALESMEDPYDGDLIIVGDGNQGLYVNRAISWSDIGIQARGRTIYKKFDLDKNYRNSREIIELAALFAHRGDTEGSEEKNGILSILVDPNKCQRPTGIKPFLIKSNTRYEENTRILKVVKDLLDGRWFGHVIEPLNPKTDPNSIGILYPYLNKQDQGVFSDLLKSLEELCPVIWVNRDQESRKRISEPGLKVQTMHSAKGLQYRAVILLWADHLPIPFGDTDEESDRRLLYVALTRSEDYLAISSSSPSKFLNEIEQSNKAMHA
ncbi:nuclease-related domain-containing DEAD/DEAH box helicase [Nitrosomonas sp. Nm34]|uniref:nuclease-related domain-containing DEAD/DEAH box helicase n=1 Tax=Nitrosomonas sp. Nm34 TaxID=1881055 RepID=UPI0008E41B8A|nr:nuclease-related domain-containing DEAD/DEAH box helicase [Nitrosomonas sp. Nm34]SFI36387.1 Superfamily I DNA and RNA helicases [Nitrosomonas sp. Nm34]